MAAACLDRVDRVDEVATESTEGLAVVRPLATFDDQKRPVESGFEATARTLECLHLRVADRPALPALRP